MKKIASVLLIALFVLNFVSFAKEPKVEILTEPGAVSEFSYTFENSKSMKAPFAFISENTGITLKFEGISSSHTLTLTVSDKEGFEIIYSDKVDMLQGKLNELYLSWIEFDSNKEYYIELSDASKPGAEGIIICEVSKAVDLNEFNIDELVNLGIIEDSLNTEEYVKRQDMAKMVAKTLRYPEMIGSETFSDVTDETKNSGYIGTLQMFGVMIGNSENMFLPENNITSDELVKTITAMLGYTPMANSEGGYPEGYIKAAKKIGLIDEGYLSSDYVTKEYAAGLIYKSLSLPLMKQTVFGAEPRYVICDGIEAELETVISNNWGVK